MGRQFRRLPGRRALRRLAWIVGGLFVLVGVAAIIGDPDAAQGTRRTDLYVRALKLVRGAFGDPGGGIALIVVGVLLGGFLYWAAGRRR